MVWAIWAAFATSIRPKPCRRQSSTHSLSRSWALIIRPRTYSASPSPPRAAASSSGVSGPASEIEAPAVLAQAAGDVAAGKAEIAAQVVDARGLGEETLRSRGCLGALQVGERPVKIVGHALDRGKADPGPAALGVVRGHVKRPLVGHERLGHDAEVVQDVALEQGERGPVGLRGRERETAPYQPQRRLVAVPGRLSAGGHQVGAGGPGVLRAVEVLGVEDRVARLEPAARAAVQLTAAAPQEAVVDRVAYQRVGEEIAAVGLPPHQHVRHKAIRDIAGPFQGMGEHGGVEALPQHGGGLQRGLVSRFEPVEPGLHQAPDRARDGDVRPLLGVAQELLEEERVASGAPHAALGHSGVGGEERLGQRSRRGRIEGAEVDREERAVPGLGAPSLVERVALGRGWSSPGRRGRRRRWRRAGPDARA